MITETLLKIFKRDLNSWITELNAYSHETNIWMLDGDILNSAGTLSLHIVGNLNHFIGAKLGNTEYVRQRDLEFSLRDVPRAELIQKLKATSEMLEAVIPSLSKTDLQAEYRRNPDEPFMTTEYFLLHLLSHLGYHLGQLNYHRRLFDVTR
ncbi:DinB family protein [Winogradskyella maritima]|uniref:DinB family protein n=1 Tax=Winogradskyella maritima TaxID=1517766 RepID=A0ABV8AC43_9FLAO|nr:DinB family protein [Winogradskyella maritima]